MSNIKSEVDAIEQKGIIRYMLYTDVNRRRATQVGQDTWVDRTRIFDDTYDYGTKHKLLFSEIDDEPSQYIVAMPPYIRQMPHPEQEGQVIPIRLIYLTTVALWPFFDPIAGETFDKAMLPE